MAWCQIRYILLPNGLKKVSVHANPKSGYDDACYYAVCRETVRCFRKHFADCGSCWWWPYVSWGSCWACQEGRSFNVKVTDEGEGQSHYQYIDTLGLIAHISWGFHLGIGFFTVQSAFCCWRIEATKWLTMLTGRQRLQSTQSSIRSDSMKDRTRRQSFTVSTSPSVRSVQLSPRLWSDWRMPTRWSTLSLSARRRPTRRRYSTWRRTPAVPWESSSGTMDATRSLCTMTSQSRSACNFVIIIIMPVTRAQETRTNQKLVQVVWYQKLARVSINLVQFFSWYKFLAHNWTQLYSITETVRRVTQTVQRDWPESCFGARNCDELVSDFSCKFFCTSFWYKFLDHLSPALLVSTRKLAPCGLRSIVE